MLEIGSKLANHLYFFLKSLMLIYFFFHIIKFCLSIKWHSVHGQIDRPEGPQTLFHVVGLVFIRHYGGIILENVILNSVLTRSCSLNATSIHFMVI